MLTFHSIWSSLTSEVLSPIGDDSLLSPVVQRTTHASKRLTTTLLETEGFSPVFPVGVSIHGSRVSNPSSSCCSLRNSRLLRGKNKAAQRARRRPKGNRLSH